MRIFLRFFILFLFSFFPFFSATGHGLGYFEFNPDISTPLNISSAANPIQVFLPLNEFIGGVDFWVDNIGPSGTLTVELRSGSGTLLSSKTINIPTISSTVGGQKIHLDFPGSIPVSGNQPYRLHLLSSMTDLNFYYSNRINFVSHNQPQSSAYVNGAANIDGEDQDFSFKFSLYENSESIPPVLSNPNIIILSPDQARLEFNSNEPIDFKIDYGLVGQGYSNSTGYSGNYIYCGQGIENCSASMMTQAGEDYMYALTAKDAWGNQSQITGNFTSGGTGPTTTPTPSSTTTPTPSNQPDTIKPIISSLRVSSVDHDSVVLAWQTDEATNSQVVVRMLPELITAGGDSDSTLELEHFVEVGNLQATTFYQAEIISADSVGNSSATTINFNTTAVPISPTPTPSQDPNQTPGPTPSSNINPEININKSNDGSTTISWDHSGSSQYRVDIFDENNFLKESIIVIGGKSAKVNNLENKNYKVIVYEQKGDAYKKIEDPKTFKGGKKNLIEKVYDFLAKYIVYLIIVLAVLTGVALRLFNKNKPPESPIIITS